MSSPPALREATKHNLTRTLDELGISSGSELVISDPKLPSGLVVAVTFKA